MSPEVLGLGAAFSAVLCLLFVWMAGVSRGRW